MLVIVAFLFVISMHFENERNQNNDLLSYNEHTTIERLKKEDLFNIMEETSVILFTNKENDNSVVKKNLYNTAMLSGINKIYMMDLTDEEANITLGENDEIIIEKKSTEFYDKLLNKLGSFAEIYGIENKYGKMINTGYQKIYTPCVIFVKNGDIIYSHYYSETIEESELKDVYLKGFELITNKNI